MQIIISVKRGPTLESNTQADMRNTLFMTTYILRQFILFAFYESSTSNIIITSHPHTLNPFQQKWRKPILLLGVILSRVRAAATGNEVFSILVFFRWGDELCVCVNLFSYTAE